MADKLVTQVDAGLARYYALKNVEYTYDGSFKKKCDDNGYDDETLVEEIELAADETQFDDEFLEDLCPWIPKDDEDRSERIREIIRNCKENPDAYNNEANAPEPLRVMAEHFDVNQSDRDKAAAMAKEQAPAVFDGGFANDLALCTMLAVTQKTQNNYLLFLVDMYLREALYNYYTHKDDISGVPTFETVHWETQNKHIKEMKKISVQGKKFKNAGEIAAAAVKSYLHRVAPKVMLKRPRRIIGSLKDVSEYIYYTVCYVDNMSKQKGSCPFQYDSVYTFGKLEEEAKNDDDEDEDDDDDDDDDDESDDDNGAVKSPQYVDVGDVKALLTENKMKFVEDMWQMGAERGFRPLDKAGRELLNQTGGPRFNRFVSIVDLRDEVKADEGHKLYVFQPQDGARKIHKDPSALNFFHNSKKSIIPDPDPDSDADGSSDDCDGQKLTAVSTGPQITLSFHVETEESVRCYFYINGQCTRFMPPDIKMLLPLFFEDTEENQEFANGEEIVQLIQKLENKLRDDAFSAFLEQYGVKCPKL